MIQHEERTAGSWEAHRVQEGAAVKQTLGKRHYIEIITEERIPGTHSYRKTTIAWLPLDPVSTLVPEEQAQANARFIVDLPAILADNERLHAVLNQGQIELRDMGAINTELMERLGELNAYVQQDLIPSIRSVAGGQQLLDRGWDLVSSGHRAVKAAKDYDEGAVSHANDDRGV